MEKSDERQASWRDAEGDVASLTVGGDIPAALSDEEEARRFGRRVAENSSQGTDHGTAGPVFLAGAGIRGGLVGDTPSLLDLEGGDVSVGFGLPNKLVFRTLEEESLPVVTMRWDRDGLRIE